MKLHKIHMLFAFMLTIFISTHADNISFDKKTFSLGNITLPYRIATLSGTSDSKASLIVYLHGGTSKGNDNELQLNEPGVDAITNWLLHNKQKAIIVVPQCPEEMSWIGPTLSTVRALLQSIIAHGIIDESRIYIFGGSMGGTGTWGMLSTYPDFFAAAMPVASDPTYFDAKNVSHTPLYTVMGTDDTIMDIDKVESFLTEMDTYDADYRFDIEEGWTHEDVCEQSYTDTRLAWVFSHTRDITNGINNATTDANDCVKAVTWYNLSGQLLPQTPKQGGMYIKKQLLYNGRTVSEKVIIP